MSGKGGNPLPHHVTYPHEYYPRLYKPDGTIKPTPPFAPAGPLFNYIYDIVAPEYKNFVCPFKKIPCLEAYTINCFQCVESLQAYLEKEKNEDSTKN